MRIGIDIDDTICDSWLTIAPTMCKDFNLDYNEIIKSKKIYNRITDMTDEQYRAYSKKYKILLKNPKLKENVRKVIEELSKQNEIIFITARPDYSFDNAYEFSKDFLERNGIYYDKIITNAKDKKIICEKEKIDVFIDDGRENCASVSELDIKVLMFENYFNEDETRFRKVKNWEEIKNIIKEENNARKVECY